MKTKNVLVNALVAVCVTVSAFASEPVISKLVVVNQNRGIFKIIYEGAKAGKVSMKITDQSGKQLFTETLRNIGGFIRPVNFDGMEHGIYTIEITDEGGTLVQSVNYSANTPFKNVYIHKTAEEGKYLLAIRSKGNEVINVRIFDGGSNLIHEEKVAVNGNLGKIYNLKSVVGTPTFEITDKDGNSVIAE